MPIYGYHKPYFQLYFTAIIARPPVQNIDILAFVCYIIVVKDCLFLDWPECASVIDCSPGWAGARSSFGLCGRNARSSALGRDGLEIFIS
jgi:hypothetical protein